MLLAWADGELAENSRRTVNDHLSSCRECRTLLAEMESAFQQLVEPEVCQRAPAQLDAGLAPLIARMRELKHAHPGTVQPQIASRVAAELELYFGSPARDWVNHLKSGQQDGSGVLAAAEPVFAAFLGRKAAAALTGRIVETLDTSGLLGESK